MTGAPKGGRVHWLVYELSNEFKSEYKILYDYSTHNYLFWRKGIRIRDFFLVMRTSKKCFRIMFFQQCPVPIPDGHTFLYYSAKTPKGAAEIIQKIWRGEL